MMKIATTTVDQIHKFLTDPDFEEGSLIDHIQGKFKGNKHTEIGTAFHDIMANPWDKVDPKREFVIAKNGVAFPYKTISKCYDWYDYNYPFEKKASKIYQVDGIEIEVVAKADQLIGEWVKEIKTTFKPFNLQINGLSGYDQFNQSVQWKLYLDIFEAQRCQYVVFEFVEHEGLAELESVHSFHFDRYPSLASDINKVLTDAIEYINYRNFNHYFERQENNENH